MRFPHALYLPHCCVLLIFDLENIKVRIVHVNQSLVLNVLLLPFPPWMGYLLRKP